MDSGKNGRWRMVRPEDRGQEERAIVLGNSFPIFEPPPPMSLEIRPEFLRMLDVYFLFVGHMTNCKNI
jgi:hypothetical protein